jgi:hypothetical protein
MHLVQQPHVEATDRGQTDKAREQSGPQFARKRLRFHDQFTFALRVKSD